jgi:hypothetical protein
VLAAALRQIAARFRWKILIRVDGAGASHELVKHLQSLSSPRWKVLFTCGWMVATATEDAIRQVPADAVLCLDQPHLGREISSVVDALQQDPSSVWRMNPRVESGAVGSAPGAIMP